MKHTAHSQRLKAVQQLKDMFLKHSSFVKFFYQDDLNLYLDQNYTNGEVTILICNLDGSHYGKLRYSVRGKLLESDLISDLDLKKLITIMERLWREGKCEAMTISRDEFMSL